MKYSSDYKPKKCDIKPIYDEMARLSQSDKSNFVPLILIIGITLSKSIFELRPLVSIDENHHLIEFLQIK